MNTRLFTDDGQERLNAEGERWSARIYPYLRSFIEDAAKEDVSIRDIVAVIQDETHCLAAETRILKGIEERKKIRSQQESP